MADINIDELISRAKISIDEVIYTLTDKHANAKKRQEIYIQSRDRVGRILQELRKITISYPDEEIAKVNEFIKSSKAKYNEVTNSIIINMTEPTNPNIGSDNITPTNSVYRASTPVKAMENIQLLSLNLGTQIKVIDGEVIDSSIENTYNVISPYTEDSNIIITRFCNSETVTKYISDRFVNPNIQPIIIYGKQAKLKYNIALEL